MNENIIQVLVQGGLASVTLVSLYILYKINTNHLAHLEKSNELFAGTLEKLSDAIDRLAEKIHG